MKDLQHDAAARVPSYLKPSPPPFFLKCPLLQPAITNRSNIIMHHVCSGCSSGSVQVCKTRHRAERKFSDRLHDIDLDRLLGSSTLVVLARIHAIKSAP